MPPKPRYCQVCGEIIPFALGDSEWGYQRKRICSQECRRLTAQQRNVIDGRKRCGRCHEWKPVDQFSANIAAADGLNCTCKACDAARFQERYQKDPGLFRQYTQANYQRHAEKHRETARRYYHTHVKTDPERAERNRERVKEWRRNQSADYGKLRYQRSRERHLAYQRRQRQEHPERKREYAKRYRDRGNEVRRRRYHTDPEFRERCTRYNIMRKALRRNSPQAVPVDRIAIANRDRWRCHLCGKKICRQDLTLDHLVPVSQGGLHVDSNVAAAHRSCNSRRQAGRIPAQLRLLG